MTKKRMYLKKAIFSKISKIRFPIKKACRDLKRELNASNKTQLNFKHRNRESTEKTTFLYAGKHVYMFLRYKKTFRND